MSARTDKKIRQQYRRDHKAKALAEAERYAAHFRNSIKPPPWWMPRFIYVRLLRLLLTV